MNTIGRIHSFESFGTLDGPGLRFIVFFQGCALRCKYCHNPDTWEIKGGKPVSVAEIVKKIDSCRSYYRNGGVTLTGGEPLLQAEFVKELLVECKKIGMHTAIDTAGSVPLSKSSEAIDAADMLLLDIKALDSDMCKELTGMDNRFTLETLDYCEKQGKPVWIRHVLVPDYTLNMTKLQELADFLEKYSCIQKVELLPFHKMGAFKWEGLGIEDPLRETNEPTSEEIAQAREIFAKINSRQK